MSDEGFVEVGHFQTQKSGQRAAGDTICTRRSENGRRTITVLSDGLGSGVKAGVLSGLTASMALRLVERGVAMERVAEAIMETLPVCSTRKISYATFSIVDIASDGRARIIEYDNPSFIYARGNRLIKPERKPIEVNRPDGRAAVIYHSQFDMTVGDRIIMTSDGVTQSGMGTARYPLGWGGDGVAELLPRLLGPETSARMLARRIVHEAELRDGSHPRDDISCLVVTYRRPRRLLVATGPPMRPEADVDLARRVRQFPGRKIVAGGTTGNIVAREHGVKAVVEMKRLDVKIPPYARMEGVDLVTEGIVTMARVAELLEADETDASENAATLFTDLILESDSIEFLVGTRVNQAHQDPRIPAQFELRRTITERIAQTLSQKHLKEVQLSYI
ncbi:MAG: SpoIIE family protein phosphatase [Spirochaetales bacterium]